MAKRTLHTWFWNLYSRCYDGLLDFIPYQRLLELTVRSARPADGQRIVDLGCGTGNTLRAVRDTVEGAELVGVDSSPSMLAVARSKFRGDAHTSFEQRDLLEWLRGAPSGSVDRLISVNVLYTMHAPQRREFWSEALRVLSPGGRLVVVTTDRAGIGPVVREHTAERSFFASLTPRLTAVIVLNLVIWLLESRKVFDPADVATLRSEVSEAGGVVLAEQRCYGGPEEGVDVLLVVERVLDLAARERTVDLAEPSAPAEAASPDGPGASELLE